MLLEELNNVIFVITMLSILSIIVILVFIGYLSYILINYIFPKCPVCGERHIRRDGVNIFEDGMEINIGYVCKTCNIRLHGLDYKEKFGNGKRRN